MKILWFIYPFCSLFIIIGAGLSFYTMRNILKARSIANWPTTEATITSCDMESYQDDEGGRQYEVTVRYKYRAFGRDYEGTRIHPAYTSSSFEGHTPLYERLKSATVVTVRYNELDPAEAYLLKGSFSAHLAAFFGGLIFLSAGLFFLLTFHFAIAGNSDYAAALEVIR